MKRDIVKTLILAAVLAGSALLAQRHKLTINAETPEGQKLQAIGTEQDVEKKTALMEAFIGEHGKHEAAGWVLSQLVNAHAKANRTDKVIEAAGKLLAIDPGDLEASLASLKAAETKNDPDTTIKWATGTSAIARKIAGTAKAPEGEDEDSWPARVDYAKQVDTYCTYAVFALAVRSTDPANVTKLLGALEQLNPKSDYLPQVRMREFQTYLAARNMEKALAIAERDLPANPANEDMLAVLGEAAFSAKNYDRASQLGLQLAQAMAAKPVPQGVDPAAWETRKKALVGQGNYWAGISAAEKKDWAATDKILRDAVDNVADEQTKAVTLFYLGLANYQMGDPKADLKLINEAHRFTTQCAAIKSPVQANAQKNLAAMRSKYKLAVPGGAAKKTKK